MAKRLARLREVDARVTALDARYSYFVALRGRPTAEARERLEALLLAGAHEPLPPGTLRLLAVPRPGTISPWSSKATDIARACGLDTVERIERGIWYALTVQSPLPPEALGRAGALLIDPMIEVLMTGAGQAAALFHEHAPEPLATIPLRAQGRAALVRANEELALALSDDEIRYLHENYCRLERDPTDVELMMFAQANSEHCRHKIFRGSWVIDGVEQEDALFDMIRSTTAASPDGILSAYADNASVIEGWEGERLLVSPQDRRYR